MDWSINITDEAEKQLRKLDKQISKRITKYLKTKLKENPRAHGKRLLGEFSDFWRYRIGDYRVIARIQENELLVLVIHIEHRSKVYKKKPKKL